MIILSLSLLSFIYGSPKSLLVIAHPDDEVMFFTPTLQNTPNLTILCLSTGNSDKKGHLRTKEIKNFTRNHNFRLILLNLFEDNEDWDEDHICSIITHLDLLNGFGKIFTFDKKGVSRHKNHISCYEAVRRMKGRVKAKIMFLKSKNLWEKYGVDLSRCVLRYKNRDVWVGMCNMYKYYGSQMRWFRYLYIVFSNYMTINDFSD